MACGAEILGVGRRRGVKKGPSGGRRLWPDDDISRTPCYSVKGRIR